MKALCFNCLVYFLAAWRAFAISHFDGNGGSYDPEPGSFHERATRTVANLRDTNLKSRVIVNQSRDKKLAAAQTAYNGAMKVAYDQLQDAAAMSTSIR